MDKIYIIIAVVISIFVIIPMSIIIYFALKTPQAPVQEIQTAPQVVVPKPLPPMVLTPIKSDNITNLPKILEIDNKTQLTSEQLKIKAIYEAAQKAEKAKK